MRDGPKDFFCGQRVGSESFAGPQRAQPLRRFCDRLQDADADNQQADEGDEERFHKQAQKCIPPEAERLSLNEAGVVVERQNPLHAPIPMDGQRIDLHGYAVQIEELADSPVPKNRLADRRRSDIQLRFQRAGDRDLARILIVNRYPIQGFPVFKPVQKHLQLSPGLVVEQWFDVVDKAFRQNLRTLFQIAPKSALLGANLEEGEDKGHQGNADGQRNNKPVPNSHIVNLQRPSVTPSQKVNKRSSAHGKSLTRLKTVDLEWCVVSYYKA